MDRSAKSLRHLRRSRQQDAASRQLLQMRQQNKTIATLLVGLTKDPAPTNPLLMRRDEKPATSPAKKGVVYFLSCPSIGVVKIGKTVNFEQRLSSLKTGCPADLRLIGWVPGYTKEESAIHKYFAGLRVCGEWFELDPRLRQYIDSVSANRGYVAPKEFFDGEFVWDATVFPETVITQIQLIDAEVNSLLPDPIKEGQAKMRQLNHQLSGQIAIGGGRVPNLA